jgi:hypothetical protein
MPKTIHALACTALAITMPGCSPAFWQGVSQGVAAASSGKLMVFGGPGHRTYLGCLSCSQYDGESIFNEYGTYGSQYSAQSILNPYSAFGSLYSTTSACNPYASDPPVIVDGNGKYYGRLTVNQYRRDGPPTAELRAWLAAVCSQE